MYMIFIFRLNYHQTVKFKTNNIRVIISEHIIFAISIIPLRDFTKTII